MCVGGCVFVLVSNLTDEFSTSPYFTNVERMLLRNRNLPVADKLEILYEQYLNAQVEIEIAKHRAEQAAAASGVVEETSEDEELPPTDLNGALDLEEPMVPEEELELQVDVEDEEEYEDQGEYDDEDEEEDGKEDDEEEEEEPKKKSSKQKGKRHGKK